MPVTLVTGDEWDPAIGRCFDRAPDGSYWLMLHESPPNTWHFFYSLDDGLNWIQSSASIATGQTTRGSMFIDADGYLHVFLLSTGSAAYYYRGTRVGNSWTFASGLQVNDTSIQSHYPAGIVAYAEAPGWRVHFLWMDTANVLYYRNLILNSDGTPGAFSSQTSVATGVQSSSPSSDFAFRHTGDGKTPHATPNLYAGYSGSGLGVVFKKGTYSAGTWSWGTARTIDGTASTVPGMRLAFDGTRVIMTWITSTGQNVGCAERDEADTATTSRTPTLLSDGAVNQITIAHALNEDIYLFAVGTTSDDPKYIRYNRGGAAWDASWTAAEATTADNRAGMTRGPDVALLYLRDLTPDESAVHMVVQQHYGQGTLQGVATQEASPSLLIAAGAVLQGVASMVASPSLLIAGGATLQGVATLVGRGLLTPGQDFTVYDGYVVSDDGVVPLIYHEAGDIRRQTRSRELQPPRTDVGNEPTEIRPESGNIFSQQDFSHGAGQLYFHHVDRDTKKYLWSEGFDLDVDTVGQPTLLRHLHDVPAASLVSTTTGKLEIFNDLLFGIDGTTIKRTNEVDLLVGSWTDDTPHAGESATTVRDITSSGEYLYAALGTNGIHRRDATTWAHWSAVQATRVAWVKNRIMASTGASIYEMATPTGVLLETLPAGWEFTSIFEAGGFVYATAENRSSGLSRIHAYGLNTALTALEKKNETPFPRDQLMRVGRGYLGVTFIGGGISTDTGGFDPVLYLAVPQDDGSLTYTKVAEGEGAGAQDLSVLAIEPVGEDVVFGWSLGSGFQYGSRDGLATLKLKLGSFLPYLKKSGAGSGRATTGLVYYKGRVVFSLLGDGVYFEDTATDVAEATLISSIADWQTTARKAWDLFQVSHARLPAGASVRLEYTDELPSKGNWTLAVTSSTAGSEVAEARLPELESRILTLRLKSMRGSTEAPTGHGFLVRSNMLPDNAEWQLVRYVRLIDEDRKDEDAPVTYMDVADRLRDLQLLAYRWVTLYEPGIVWTVRVDRVAEVPPALSVFDETGGESRQQAYLLEMALSGTRD